MRKDIFFVYTFTLLFFFCRLFLELGEYIVRTEWLLKSCNLHVGRTLLALPAFILANN
jgi:hypothetical protein